MPKPITIFQSSTGLNTKVDPERIRWNPSKGITDLAIAVDCDVDDTGRLSRRKGFDKTVVTLDSRSLFCDGGACLFVSDSSLYRLHTDFSYTSLRSDLTAGARMSYQQVNREIFYCNGYQSGRFSEADGASHAWSGSPYVGPDSTRTIEDPPVGHIVAYYRGRIYIAVESDVYFTEGLAYSWVDPEKNYLPFAGRLRMIQPVDDGIYISTDRNIKFLLGDPVMDGGFTVKDVAEYPAIEGTNVRVDTQLFSKRRSLGLAAMFATTEGLCLGLNSGFMVNLTQDKISYPSASWGAGLAKEGQYIALLAS